MDRNEFHKQMAQQNNLMQWRQKMVTILGYEAADAAQFRTSRDAYAEIRTNAPQGFH